MAPTRLAGLVFTGFSNLFASDAKLLLEESLSVQELANAGLATRHQAVHLDPHTSHRNEATLRHLPLHVLEQGRVELLDPLKLLGLQQTHKSCILHLAVVCRLHGICEFYLRTGELEVGIAFKQTNCGCEASSAFANRFSVRPQPRRVCNTPPTT